VRGVLVLDQQELLDKSSEAITGWSAGLSRDKPTLALSVLKTDIETWTGYRPDKIQAIITRFIAATQD